MTALKPSFSLSIGAARSASENPVGMPRSLTVERDMRLPADSCEAELARSLEAKPGDEVTVELGLGGEAKKVFTGEVVELHRTLEGFRLRALGKMNALLNLRVSAAYLNETVGGIVRDLVGQANLTAGTVSDGPTLPHFYVDRRCGGYHYVRELADRLGFVRIALHELLVAHRLRKMKLSMLFLK